MGEAQLTPAGDMHACQGLRPKAVTPLLTRSLLNPIFGENITSIYKLQPTEINIYASGDTEKWLYKHLPQHLWVLISLAIPPSEYYQSAPSTTG